MSVLVLAYAKLNLSLDVLSARPDGFHEIRSIVQTIDLADRIEIEPAGGIHVSCSRPIDGTNLAERAVRALLDEKGVSAGVRIRIEKNIPIGAGLGGGSSDAAAVLTSVNALVAPRLGDGVLMEIAETMGSDVPLFLTGGCMRLAGRGRPEQRLPVRSESFVLLVPDIFCATRDVYGAWRSDDKSVGESELGRNDLYPAAVRVRPELAGHRAMIREIGGLYSGMTGSGSAFFAAFASHAEATAASEQLMRRDPDSRIYCCASTMSGSRCASTVSGSREETGRLNENRH